MMKNNIRNVIAGYSSIIDDKCIWFFAYSRNYLCCYNYKNGEKNIYPVSNNFNDCDRQLYHTILTIDTWLLLIPRVANDIVLFNKETKEIHRMEIPRHKVVSSAKFLPDDAKFCSGFTYGRCFFLLGVAYPGIIKVNIDNFQIEIIDDWVDEVNKYIERDYIGYISLGVYINNDKAIISLMCVQGVLILDLKSLSTTIRLINGSHTGGMYGLSGDTKGNLWTTGFNDRDNTICCITDKTIINRYSIDDNNGKKHLFYPPVLTKNGVYLIPVQYEKCIYRLDEASKSFKKWIDYEQTKEMHSISGYSFMEPIVYNDKIVFVDGQNFEWHFVNDVNGEDYSFQIDVEYDVNEINYWKRRVKSTSKYGSIISEQRVSIDLFLKLI